MKQIYILKGLDCASCALKLERKIQKIDGVESCQINFLAEKMTIDLNDNAVDKVFTTFKNFEYGVSLKRIK